jgi:hypothetical protein
MADFALWSTACETAFCPAGSFLRAYKAKRRAAIEDVVEADPVAARIRDIMDQRTAWAGNASDLLRIGADVSGDDASRPSAGWRNRPGRLPAGCVARGRRFEHWESKFPFVVRGERGLGSLTVPGANPTVV